jgi:hypothetical protein
MPRINDIQEARNARNLGVSIEEYRRQRIRVKSDKTRGRGARKASELDEWGLVEGQIGLFDTE